MSSIDEEWARVVQNPDNMMVSDVLRGRIESLMTETQEETSLIPTAVLYLGNDPIQMDLLRVEHSQKGWALVGTAHISAGMRLSCADRVDIKTAVIMQDPQNEVWRRDLVGCDVNLGVDFHAEVFTCTITLGCTFPSVQTRVL